ncbi:hypothetical protein CHQ87_0012650, partial [Escherichia coli]
LHGDVLMWLMKTLLTSGCTNQRGAGQAKFELSLPIDKNPPLLTLIIIFHRLMSMIHSAYPTVSHYQTY